MADARTPARPPARKAVAPSTGKQQSILGFFAKTPSTVRPSASKPPRSATATADDENEGTALSSPCLRETKANPRVSSRAAQITPLPSSDPAEPSSSQENATTPLDASTKVPKTDALPSPFAPAETAQKSANRLAVPTSSPTRKARKQISYAESSDEDDDVFVAMTANQRRNRNRTRTVADDDEDYASGGVEDVAADEDDDMADFVVSDEESDAPSKAKKRKRPSKADAPRKRPTPTPTPVKDENYDDFDEELFNEVPSTSTAQKWRFDPDNVQASEPGSTATASARTSTTAASTAKAGKEKAHTKEPEDRYTWLANVRDMDKNEPGHPDFDKGTIYIPPNAWHKFSPFEKQYWEIKQKLYDTILFFKKGKFYELYENDATIGHQLFDFKMTDRVNMRMVGVPESSLDIWVNQFVSKGYKVARVDQMESALGKEMRERGASSVPKSKQDKIIRRELACVLTRGTLVDGSMLQDDMATYCAAIKQCMVDDKPVFGVAFVDAATGQFFLSEFEDDVDLTKFETFVAQTAPQELLLEKSHLSTKALRILKNNTTPMTIWNYRKPGAEFWDDEMTRRELESGDYFVDEEGAAKAPADWPQKMQEMREKPFLMSAFGALVNYLRGLKLERNLLSQSNFEWYNPIHRNGTLILDGQTLINLEIFANTVNGGPEGTLFNLLNRCITPFGKRLFRKWVCHPLCNIQKINERLDAVDMLNADRTLRDQFSAEMSKMPDLERLGSRIHAGAVRPEDFVRVLEGYEHIEYTTSLLRAFSGGNSIVDQLVAAMPDLNEPLAYWKTAFDRKRAREEKVLIPERGIDEDFDTCCDTIERIKGDLHTLLDEQKSMLKCRSLKFTDVGKEIYQVEVPKSIKVPKTWRQMSATSAVKRYYFNELTDLVRELQEAEETRLQMVREVALRFCARFDADADIWLEATRIIAQLDCLISLAKASSSMGQPSCRPVFVDEDRSVVEFEELRHPCMINAVDDFIPNDVRLGGDAAKINLLTGANAAGKSTILRMSCIAVIMAQIGCYVPAVAARLTPVDRIMSRLGANDNIFAAQSTFFVELSETKKILSEATPRSLVILDELGRGTSSYDGVAVAQAVLHHVASHIGCVGFFATHYHSLATEFENHPEIRAKRMQIHVDDANRQVTFLYKLEDGVAEGSFGMHCAAMCGIPTKVITDAEVAAREWEHTSRLKDSLDRAKTGCYIPLGILSDVAALLRPDGEAAGANDRAMDRNSVEVLLQAIEAL
ncbi:DNA mismatch repair protein MSH6 [Sporothrix brasiliensis 5110]|uniref:DNA mismatch repair protein n=1 Tax=Sporothrix brasiliensis 5110 TaxID=1398154 RepID=A0A0C2IMH1_9PEZI|nr:DNA mismatch repair protein MSH6 [Sporothrix brasiliensis 5110]KIH90236.1 DNA mismatch repair protein MSH6 [Sporothrix brasiliensis 5110]